MLIDLIGSHVGSALLPELVSAPTQRPNWNSEICKNQLDFLEERLKGGWLVGHQLSLADFSVAAMTTYFKFTEFPFESYPCLTNWYDAITELSSWRNTSHPLWC